MALVLFETGTENVESLRFGFYTDEEVRNCSFKKITSPALFDSLNRPTQGGLYDPALGPIEVIESCKSCGEPFVHCPGHCGHIDLVLPVYNPLLFSTLRKLMSRICLFCHHFMISNERIQKFASKLELIMKGDIVSSKNLCSMSSCEHGMRGTTTSTMANCSTSQCFDQCNWTSLQYHEARSLYNEVMSGSIKLCENCGSRNPKIRSPTFGRLYMEPLASADIRSNVIRGSKLEQTGSFGEDKTYVLASGNVINPSQAELSSTTSDNLDINADGTHKEQEKHLPPEFLTQWKSLAKQTFLTPLQVKDHLRLLWENEPHFCSLISDIQQVSLSLSRKKASYSMFFIQALVVPPSKFRAPTKRNNEVLEHPQNVLLSRVLQNNIFLGDAITTIAVDSERSRVVQTLNRWMYLQESINVLFDSSKALNAKDKENTGICQLLDKKEGLFRQKMMGKRVNFSCRSVISPDPYLAVNEIGIPPYFAERLTYPEKVTPWNVNKLRLAIINGPKIQPGATHYADKKGISILPFSKNHRISIAKKLPTSCGVVTHAGKTLDSEFEGKVVCRQMQDGDIVLVNRQPTLHKPSMMAHVVRVLKGEKTLRMHYANCSTYNADFDGDEINVHFPQDEIARSEAYNIVNANEQYIVPTSGDPIRGLIQDHIVSAVLLTKKDTFLTKEEYHQLFYSACASAAATALHPGKHGQKICTIDSDAELHPLPPAIWKPKPLWTGKQVITTVLNHITSGRPPFTMKKMGKISREYFSCKSGQSNVKVPNNSKEFKLRIQNNELVHGVIDKAQFGKYGLVHIVQELYGANTAGILLSVFSRLFTIFLQMYGFTCGVDDLLITKKLEETRKKKLEESEKIGKEVHAKFVLAEDGGEDPMKLQMEIEKLLRSKGESETPRLDMMMSSELNKLASGVSNKLIPNGLLKSFPYNCLLLMTTTGAKGSSAIIPSNLLKGKLIALYLPIGMSGSDPSSQEQGEILKCLLELVWALSYACRLVNFNQISSLLGQQELEGKRVPRMASGKTLPCFPPWDIAARAGGFIGDRFMTGLRPQEYYFHCMAGRDGLVDTAIKTSRSGYLQRCLIKNLECLKVCYDYTVRDVDGSIVQFCYGEDGVDVLRTSCLTEFKILSDNQSVVHERLSGGQIEPAREFKSNSYIKLPDVLVDKANKFIDKQKRSSLHRMKRKHLIRLMELKYLSSLAQPGEPVGVLAAQSIGEPSTQMTLNTFHFAGRGEMNVTLGIPRLKEILMLASKKIGTPFMMCPLQAGRTRVDAAHLAAKLARVRLADLVESMEVCVVPFSIQEHLVTTTYKLKLKLNPPELYFPYSDLTEADCENALKSSFFKQFKKELAAYLKKSSAGETDGITVLSENQVHDFAKEINEEDVRKRKGGVAEENDDVDNDDDDERDEDQGVEGLKRRRQVKDDMDYEDELSDLEDGDREEEQMIGIDSENDQFDDGNDRTAEDHRQLFEAKAEVAESPPQEEIKSKARNKSSKKAVNLEVKEKKTKSKQSKKSKKSGGLINATILDARGLNFEARFSCKKGTHILLSLIAEKVLKRVYIRSTNKIDRCKVVEKEQGSGVWALQTAGINFQALWEISEDLDFRHLSTNDIYAVLETYGVEAARATIITEVKKVFESYGITVNSRHLSLVADFMTYGGGYRPMNRNGIVNSTSPLHKITFETATKFLVESAYRGEVETLEAPSARIALGMPVKMGTGCFDILQNFHG